MRIEYYLDFSVGVTIDLDVWRVKAGIEVDLVFVRYVETNLAFVRWSKMTCVYCGIGKLGLCVEG